jgi:hypothetical protein
MKIELKNISYNASLSEETSAFTGRIYVDGVYTADVSNHGHGDPDMVRAVKGQEARLAAAEAWCKAQPPVEAHGMSLDYDLEMKVGELLEDYLLEKDFNRLMKSKVLVKSDKGIMQYSWKGVRAVEKKHIDMIKAKFPDAVILNAMPRDEAFSIFKAGV